MLYAAPDASQTRQEWVIGDRWWWLPLLVILFASLCCGLFSIIDNGDPNANNLSVINIALFSTGYTLVALLSPGFGIRHVLAAAIPQFWTPFLISRIDSNYEPWLLAQLLTTGSLLLIHRVVAVPCWRHERFNGQVRRTFSIRGLMMLTMIAALVIVGFQWTNVDQDFFLIVASLCGPPLIGWVIALYMTRWRAKPLIIVVVTSGLLLVVTCILDAKLMFHIGYGEVEPLAMLAALLATMLVINLWNIPFLMSSFGRDGG